MYTEHVFVMPVRELKLGFLLRDKWLTLVFRHLGIARYDPDSSYCVAYPLFTEEIDVDVGFLPVVVLTCSFSQAIPVDGGPPSPKTHVVYPSGPDWQVFPVFLNDQEVSS
jgi:hypothetical protein